MTGPELADRDGQRLAMNGIPYRADAVLAATPVFPAGPFEQAIARVDSLLQAMQIDSRAPGAWGQLLRSEIETALTQVQILRMTIMLKREGRQKLEAARSLDGTLRNLNLRASKARMGTLDRTALALARKNSLAALCELERSVKTDP